MLRQAHAFAAISEVMVGVTGPITMLTHGMRTAAANFFYIQFLCKRCARRDPSPHSPGPRAAALLPSAQQRR
jgi:hypothetical protein